MIRLGLQRAARFIHKPSVEASLKDFYPYKLVLQPNSVVAKFTRSTSFFNKLGNDDLWKGVTTISNPGRKRGRGKLLRKKPKFDYGKVSLFGKGRANIQFPGLNAPIMKGSEVQSIEIPKKEADGEHNLETADQFQRPKRFKRFRSLHPLERGWTGNSQAGRSVGPPTDKSLGDLSSFNTIIIDSQIQSRLRGPLGRIRYATCHVLVGNYDGLLGIGNSKAPEPKTALRKAMNRAASRLVHYKFMEKGTINHDFIYTYNHSKVVAIKKPSGYGLVCHRVIQECCKLIGIKDIYVKVLGSTNVKNVVKAFLLGLLEQKTYQELADARQLHLVEIRKERDYFPVLKASPEKVLTEKELGTESYVDFKEYVMGRKILTLEPKVEDTPTYLTYLKKNDYKRNHEKMKLKLRVEYGNLRSFLADVYPECVARLTYLKMKSRENKGEDQESDS